MTKSLEALVADMKAAAEKATPGQWVYLPKNTSIEYDVGSDESQGSICYMDSGDFTQRITELNGLHVATANPENVLKLIAELEGKESHISKLEAYSKTTLEFREAARKENISLKSDLAIAEKRIAELEALCVKSTGAMREVAPLCVKLPDGYKPTVIRGGQQSTTYRAIMSSKGDWIHKELVIEAICAAGGTVTGSD